MLYFLQTSEKAKPAKAGDAKPWVYRRASGHDRQAAEDRNAALDSFGLADRARLNYSDG
jgi:hypothetical protein